jgi:hypothetical protein
MKAVAGVVVQVPPPSDDGQNIASLRIEMLDITGTREQASRFLRAPRPLREAPLLHVAGRYHTN